MAGLFRLRPPPPIEPGYYCVRYRQEDDPDDIKTVHMQLARYGYRSRLMDFCDLNACTIVSYTRVKNLAKDIKWTRTE